MLIDYFFKLTWRTLIRTLQYNKKGDVVMISLDDWSAIQETLYLLSIPGMRESILNADKTPLEEWKDAKDIGWDI